MRVGVVVGLTAEARIVRQLGWPVAIGGGTAAGAGAAARALVSEGSEALISFGLAGGLDTAVRPGTVIVPSAVIVDEARFETDPALSRLLGGATPHLLLGAGSIVASVEEKRRLREQTGAAAVDLESGAVGQVASAHGIPFAVLRSICDPADRALPPAALATLGWSGEIDVWRVLISIVAHPGQLPALFELAAAAAAAKRSLVERVRQIAGAAMQSGLHG